MADKEEQPTDQTDQLDNIVIVDGLPAVPKEKCEKLFALIKKISNAFGCATQAFELCQGANGATTGYAFVEYKDKAGAERAISKMHGQSLDKKHVFSVCLFSDWTKFKDIPETYSEPKEEEQQPDENLNTWLLDDSAREQYLVRHNEETEVWWNDPMVLGKQNAVEKRKGWTDIIARWSPLGVPLLLFPLG